MKLNQPIRLPEKFGERASALLAPLPLHLAGVLLLAVLNVYLVVHIVVNYSIAHNNNEDAQVQQDATMRASEIAARPLRGLDAKLATANDDAAKFYHQRIPTAYSTVAGQLGMLAKKNNVHLTRVQYVQGPGLNGLPETALTEIKMDATLSGDYRPLMLFLNGLERNKSFFLVTGITLSGQQSGVVNLRMRLSTWLRTAAPGEKVDTEDEKKAIADGVILPVAPEPAAPRTPFPRPNRGGAR